LVCLESRNWNYLSACCCIFFSRSFLFFLSDFAYKGVKGRASTLLLLCCVVFLYAFLLRTRVVCVCRGCANSEATVKPLWDPMAVSELSHYSLRACKCFSSSALWRRQSLWLYRRTPRSLSQNTTCISPRYCLVRRCKRNLHFRKRLLMFLRKQN
jgi:hypothetical protein